MAATTLEDFRLLFESAPGLYLVLAPSLHIVAVTDAYLRATMTQREQILGRHLFDVFPDDPADPNATGVANLARSLERVLRERCSDSMAVQEYPVRAEGSGEFTLRFWSPVNSPVFGRGGELAFILHEVQDVTEFILAKRAETTHQKAVDELRTRAGAMESEIYRRAQEIQNANLRLRELGADLERRVEARTAELVRANADLEAQMAERGKAEAALRVSQEQLHHSQKMEAIGRLAGGVAHDFNNLLTVVIGMGELLLDESELPEKCRPDVAEILYAGQRAAELTKQLLALGRRGPSAPRVVDVNEIVGAFQTLLARVLGEDIELRLIRAPGAASVHMDPSHVESILMNLVVNARDAMPRGGKLTVETARVELDEAYTRTHLGVAPGPFVLIAVSDTGVGMDAETQARVFEPFFTTKAPGKGSGLGLSTVFGLAKQGGGAAWLYSEPGMGTTFKIYLPRVLTESQSPVRSDEVVVGGDETILLVEDDVAVRRVALRMLRDLGYHVLESESPSQAITICTNHPEKIHALVTDVVMPTMNGAELAQHVRALRTRIKVVFTSGYTGDVVLQHGILDAEVVFVEKPLDRRTLARTLRTLLDAPIPSMAPPTGA